MIRNFLWWKMNLFIYCTRTYSRHCEVGARQCQGKRQEEKTREKSEEMERDRRTGGETSHPNQGNWRTHTGRRTKWKTGEEKERNEGREGDREREEEKISLKFRECNFNKVTKTLNLHSQKTTHTRILFSIYHSRFYIHLHTYHVWGN